MQAIDCLACNISKHRKSRIFQLAWHHHTVLIYSSPLFTFDYNSQYEYIPLHYVQIILHVPVNCILYFFLLFFCPSINMTKSLQTYVDLLKSATYFTPIIFFVSFWIEEFWQVFFHTINTVFSDFTRRSNGKNTKHLNLIWNLFYVCNLFRNQVCWSTRKSLAADSICILTKMNQKLMHKVSLMRIIYCM